MYENVIWLKEGSKYLFNHDINMMQSLYVKFLLTRKYVTAVNQC